MENTLKFMSLIGKLKTTKRTGWVYRDVKAPESVSDHMYRMAMFSFLLADQKDDIPLDKDRCIKLALVHDLAECIVGDIAPADGVSDEEKHRQEKAAMEHVTTLIGKDAGSEVLELWKEYSERMTPEAKFVKDLDRFEMILQAYEYERAEGNVGRLQDFFESTKGKFQHPLVVKWVEELYKQRHEAS